MLWNLFLANETYGERESLVTSRGVTTWRELARLACEATGQLSPLQGTRVGVLFQADAWGLSALAALDRLSADVFLIDHELSEVVQDRFAVDFQWSAVVATSEPDRWLVRSTQANASRVDPSVTILTSGTTGLPKAVRHTWESLTRPVRHSTDPEPQRWLLTYRPRLYAGLQVILQTFVNGGTLIVPDQKLDPAGIAELMRCQRVEFVSATPSYWRGLLLHADREELSSIPLRQITIGGEAVDQVLLDQLRSTFPATRIVHVYASTEMGRCFSVTDGRAGFPRDYLERELPGKIRLCIIDGQLHIKSSNSMRSIDDRTTAARPHDPAEWFPTGDVVRLDGDRVYFLGRNSDLVNVGGNKVSPLTVEQAIRELPQIADARVYGQSSSITGQIVACQIVAAAGVSAQAARQAVVDLAANRLDRFHRPRLITVVDRIEPTASGKIRRSC
jgi:acyl-coenzyme A synthetase/AMP-(fatty) acid ligase